LRSGFALPAPAGILLALALLTLACGPQQESTPTGRRAWEGPGNQVSSSGITVYERRELAQRVELPACLHVAERAYAFDRVTVTGQSANTPAGLADTMYRLDRWRLWTRPGALTGREELFLTIRGSSGILAEYRPATGQSCL
jgi:hypothetical protein